MHSKSERKQKQGHITQFIDSLISDTKKYVNTTLAARLRNFRRKRYEPIDQQTNQRTNTPYRVVGHDLKFSEMVMLFVLLMGFVTFNFMR